MLVLVQLNRSMFAEKQRDYIINSHTSIKDIPGCLAEKGFVLILSKVKQSYSNRVVYIGCMNA